MLRRALFENGEGADMNFYDTMAEHYSDVVDEAGRAEAVERFARELTGRAGGGRALDLACGAGLYSVALARAGMEVVGVDLSPGMLGLAEKRAKDAGVKLALHQGPMQHLPQEIAGPFTLIVCMGNSVPHLLSEADLAAFFSGAATRLADDGLLAIHLLNYDRILDQRHRIVGVTRSDDAQRTFVRFYDFPQEQSHTESLRFNILELRWDGKGNSEYDLQSTELRPWRKNELADAMAAAGLTDVEAYGGLDLAPFDHDASDTLLLLARR
jgi:SAM-dependent methyltransferase